MSTCLEMIFIRLQQPHTRESIFSLLNSHLWFHFFFLMIIFVAAADILKCFSFFFLYQNALFSWSMTMVIHSHNMLHVCVCVSGFNTNNNNESRMRLILIHMGLPHAQPWRWWWWWWVSELNHIRMAFTSLSVGQFAALLREREGIVIRTENHHPLFKICCV